jgi:hypothetical protein
MPVRGGIDSANFLSFFQPAVNFLIPRTSSHSASTGCRSVELNEPQAGSDSAEVPRPTDPFAGFRLIGIWIFAWWWEHGRTEGGLFKVKPAGIRSRNICDHLHRRPALGTAKRIRFVNLLDQCGPAFPGFPGRGRADRSCGSCRRRLAHPNVPLCVLQNVRALLASLGSVSNGQEYRNRNPSHEHDQTTHASATAERTARAGETRVETGTGATAGRVADTETQTGTCPKRKEVADGQDHS